MFAPSTHRLPKNKIQLREWQKRLPPLHPSLVTTPRSLIRICVNHFEATECKRYFKVRWLEQPSLALYPIAASASSAAAATNCQSPDNNIGDHTYSLMSKLYNSYSYDDGSNADDVDLHLKLDATMDMTDFTDFLSECSHSFLKKPIAAIRPPKEENIGRRHKSTKTKMDKTPLNDQQQETPVPPEDVNMFDPDVPQPKMIVVKQEHQTLAFDECAASDFVVNPSNIYDEKAIEYHIKMEPIDNDECTMMNTTPTEEFNEDEPIKLIHFRRHTIDGSLRYDFIGYDKNMFQIQQAEGKATSCDCLTTTSNLFESYEPITMMKTELNPSTKIQLEMAKEIERLTLELWAKNEQVNDLQRENDRLSGLLLKQSS